MVILKYWSVRKLSIRFMINSERNTNECQRFPSFGGYGWFRLSFVASATEPNHIMVWFCGWGNKPFSDFQCHMASQGGSEIGFVHREYSVVCCHSMSRHYLIQILMILRPSDTCMCLWTVPPLVQIMAWRWTGDKPLSEPILVNCQLAPKEQNSVKF